MDSPVIWLVLKLDHVVSLPLKTSGTLTKSSLFVYTKPSRSFRKELRKVALLTSYTIWNARQEPAWGSENQPLLSAWFSFNLGVALSFAGFISEFLCLSDAVVVFVCVCVWGGGCGECGCVCVWGGGVGVCVCVCAALRRSEPLGPLLVLGFNVLPFVMHFALVVSNGKKYT